MEFVKDKQSNSGCHTSIWGNLITWKSRKKLSSDQWRTRLVNYCLKIILEEIMKLYCNNKIAINIARDPV